ncbi:hypothetical protein BHUM_05391 [Candidatus Burkholderia humilis]|nr:hypothetical protein BHUM_05391 [Candidatus Burkholderia humilis]
MGYRSVYADDDRETWHSTAVVRTSLRTQIGELYDAGSSHLLSSLATEFADHAYISALEPVAIARIRWGRLTDYLFRTERVEIEIVNRALTHLLTQEDLPQPLRTDLLKIYTDEAYHVLVMAEFGLKISNLTGFEMLRRDFAGLNRITQEINSATSGEESLACLTAAIVTETLISGTLRRANDDSVYAPVRAVLSDHARDESYHHAAFSRLGKSLLPRLTATQREIVEYIVPIAIREFLTPDVNNVIEDLSALGLSNSQIEEIIVPLIDERSLQESLRSASVATRRLFEGVGITSVI